MNDTPVACQTRGPTRRETGAPAGGRMRCPSSPVPAAAGYFAPRRERFLCLRRPHFFQQRKKWGKERRQKLRFCTSSARYACSPLSVFPHVTGVFLIVVVPPTVPAQLSAAAACYYGKNYSFCRVAGYYILCPTGTPTFAALRRQRRDLIIANPVEANTPTVAGQAVAEASAPVNAGTVLLTDSDDRCTPPASTHRQIRTCPPRAKGPLDRRSKWFSLVPFFLQKKKGTRAGGTKLPIPRPQAVSPQYHGGVSRHLPIAVLRAAMGAI